MQVINAELEIQQLKESCYYFIAAFVLYFSPEKSIS